MVTCPLCDSEIDLEEDEIEEGDEITCDECGAELRVSSVDPDVELEPVEEEEDEEEGLGFDKEDEEEEDWR